MRIEALVQLFAAVGILTSAMTLRADARYLEIPKELPIALDLRVAGECPARSAVLSLIGELASAEQGRATASDIPMRVVKQRDHRIVVFGRPPKGHEPSLKTMIECLTIYAGSPQMLMQLGLHVPDEEVPTGWFTYDPRIGIYADPRTVTLFPSAK